MKYSATYALTLLMLLVLLTGGTTATVREMDKQAQEYLNNKQYNQAIALWLNILDVDPENEKAQRQIEVIYEIKQKKDLSMQRAKLNYRLARNVINRNLEDPDISLEDAEDNLETTKKKAKVAFDNFISAYRLDPKDPELNELVDDMKRLEQIIKSEEEKQRLSRELKEKYKRLLEEAKEAMKNEEYRKALNNYNEILDFFPDDQVAQEGKREAQLAIENRLRYEKVQRFLARGKGLFEEEKYQPARLEFVQVLNLDERNRTAQRYIDRIDEKMDEKKLREQRLRQAEEFYVAGNQNLVNNQFEQARDNFESVLALVDEFRDTRAKLESIDRLKERYLKLQRERKLQKINEEFQNGMLALSEGRYRDAVAAFETTLNLDPENELAKTYMERAKTALKQQQEEQVDENSPYYNIVNSLIISGRNLYNQGKYEESREKWERILELFPKNRIATEYLLRCNIKMNPGSFEPFAKRLVKEGREHLAKREYQEALRKFELIKSLDQNYPGLEGLIAQARRDTNRAVLGGAQKGDGGEEEVRATPAQIQARYNRAVALYQQGGRANLQQALADFRWVARAQPNNIRAIISANKIEAQLRMGGGGGQADVARQDQLTPEQRAQVRRYYYNGISFYSNNNFQAAIREWRKVLAIDPNHVKARNNIRKVLVFLGRQ